MATSILLFFFRRWEDNHPTFWFKDKKTTGPLGETKDRVRDGHFQSYCSSLQTGRGGAFIFSGCFSLAISIDNLMFLCAHVSIPVAVMLLK